MWKLIVCATFIVSLWSCSATKDVFKFKKEDIIFGLKKGACFGKCSVYTLDIYKNRYAVYEGKINVEKYGIFSKQLSKEEYDGLYQAYLAADFMNFKDEYSSFIEDLPMIIMDFRKDKILKTVSGKLERPAELVALQNKMEEIANSKGWKVEKAYEVQSTNDVTQDLLEVKDNVIESQIIIEPKMNVPLALWFKKYAEYDVQLIKKIAPNLNYWLITYDKSSITPKEMIAKIKSDKDIISAEFNKLLSPREH